MSFCTCNLTLQNTGTPSKQQTGDVAKNLILVQMVADDGTRNSIAVGDTIDDAYVTALINNADKSKRWFPVNGFKNVEDARGDQITESFEDGTSIFVKESARTFQGVIPSSGPTFLGKLRSFSCTKIGVYIVDNCGNIIGSKSADGSVLYPIAIETGTFYARLVKATDTTSPKVQLNFEYSVIEKDENLRSILASEIVPDMLTVTGLLDVEATISSEATTGFVAALTLSYGSFISPIKVIGWLLADFTLFNVTQDAAITITSVTENPDGTYTFVFPAATSADVLLLTSSKNGFELSQEVTVP